MATQSGRPKPFRPISLRKSLATNFFGSFPQEIGRHKTFSAHFLRKSAATKLFGSFPEEIGRHKTVSAHFLRKSATHLLTHFLRKSATHLLTHFLRKSLDDLHRTGRYSYILTSNSRFRRCTWKGAFLMRSPCSSSPNRLKNTVLVRFFLHLAIRSRSDRFSIVK